MNSTTNLERALYSFLMGALATASFLFTPLTAQAPRLGPTVYGFGEGEPGLEGLPRTLTIDPLLPGSTPQLSIEFGNPDAVGLLVFGALPTFAPLPVAGAELSIAPAGFLVTQPVVLDVNASAHVPFITVPNVRTIVGLTLYGQYLEVVPTGFAQSTAFAATAAGGCNVSVQATGITLNAGGVGEAFFSSINVPPGCTWRRVSQSVARPANGVTITGIRSVNPNVKVDIDASGAAPGTPISIQLEIWCTCNGVVSQHFAFARGTR